MLETLIEKAVLAERERCVRIALAEYGRWRDAEPDTYGIACGAIGAAANIVAAIENIPCVASEPVHVNETWAGLHVGDQATNSE